MSGQRTLSLETREFDPTDYPRLSEIYNANYPDYSRSSNEWRARDESVDRSKYHLQRYAFLDNKVLVGFGTVAHVTDMFHPRKFWIDILVDPESQGRGIGGAVYERLSRELGKVNAIIAWAGSREDLPRLTGFYQRRGFEQKQIAWESRLDVPGVDMEIFRGYSERVQKQGVMLTSLAEEKREDPHSLRKLHELVQLISADMPSPAPFTPTSYEQWEAFELKNPNILPEGYMIAKDGSKYVGLSTVWRIEKEPRALAQGNTGVRREYRGRGIAVALKLKMIDYARRNGYVKVKTWNASENASMLAVNMKLGFKRQVGWITLEKDLTR
ncbi:MAG TPA: GNAT family N-acetyltransferase [Candidatus Bathyarchaeia archaeon]|nr:GNAT family N-acetyltransferase [Candidatus Bathyarchaeia archaeon]